MPAIFSKKTSKTSVKPRVPAARLSVDFPKQNEVIGSAHYTFRLSAPEGAKTVEAAVDQGEWQACRPALGFWWYDWSGYGDGEHEVIARFETRDGRKTACEPHGFFVDLHLKPTA